MGRRLYDAIDQWAFCALSSSPGARAFYDQRRDAGDLHHQALRALGNRLAASSTAASATAPTTTNTSPGTTAAPPKLLDDLRPWDVYTLIEAARARWRSVNAPHLVALVRAGALFHKGELLERAVEITPGPSQDTPASEVA